MTENAEKVFRTMCMYAQDWNDIGVYPVRQIAQATGLSVYKVRNAINELRAAQLVERGCVGRPAIESGYEYKELECEAMPPLHGFSLTDKAVDTEIFKSEEKKMIKSLSDLANDKSDII